MCSYMYMCSLCAYGKFLRQVYETFFLEVVLESYPSRPDSASLCKPYYNMYYILKSICSEISPLSFHKRNICVGPSTLIRLIQLLNYTLDYPPLVLHSSRNSQNYDCYRLHRRVVVVLPSPPSLPPSLLTELQ